MQEADFSLGEYTAKKVACSVAVRKCKVSVADLEGIEHTVEVTAATLSEAMAAAPRHFPRRRVGWPDRQQTHHGQCHRPTACRAAPSASQRLPDVAAKEGRLARRSRTQKAATPL